MRRRLAHLIERALALTMVFELRQRRNSPSGNIRPGIFGTKPYNQAIWAKFRPQGLVDESCRLSLYKAMDAQLSSRSNQAARSAIILLALVAHGWILINDGRYLDATYFEYFFEAGRYDILHWNFSGVAMEPWLWLMSPLLGSNAVGPILKAAELLALATIGLVVYDGAQRFARFRSGEALALASLTITFPVYVSSVMSNTVIYLVPTAMFYVAWHRILAEGVAVRPRRWLQVGALTLLALSYLHNSLLVFHYAFLGFLLVRLRWQGAMRPFLAALPALLARQAVLVLLPIAFFLFRTFVHHKPGPPFDSHNTLSLNPLVIGKSFLQLFNEGIVLTLLAALGENLFLLGLVAALLGAHLFSARTEDPEWRQTAARIGFGLVFLGAALFPYAAVGKGVPASSLGARYFIQGGLGVALLLVATLGALPDALAKLRGVLAAALVFAFTLVGIDGYLMWQARWAKDRATIQALARLPPIAAGTAVIWEDRMKIGAEVYRQFELSWFLQMAWGRQAWYPLYVGDRDLAILVAEPLVHTTYKDAYLLADFDWNGCTAPLVVEAKVPRETDRQIARHYLMARFAGGNTLESYLDSLVTIRIGQPTCGLTLPEKKP